MSIIDKISNLIIKSKMTPSQISRKSKISRPYLYRIINKQVTNLSSKTISSLCDALGVSQSTLLDSSTKIPVLGTIRAGLPLLAEENIIDYEEIPEKMALANEYYGLKITGDSMAPRILDGDVVIVEKTSLVENGDICVVLINGDEATIKKIKITDQGLTLIPTNPAYDIMPFDKQQIQELPVEIIGKVVELRGKF